MELKLEVLDDIEAPISTGDGIALTVIALGSGILIGIAIT